MQLDIENKAQVTIAGVCAHLAKDNHADAVSLVNMFLNDQMSDGLTFPQAIETLARAGIIIAMLAAEPDVEGTFERITTRLALSEIS
ncbi:hypothetical protein UFOVP1264_28 [uncultured Caudovirales phage]|uniref:Uncharacterized protein n=1 Tax=uncultured Caudovirales phage TaxID=2100421 RepID=A0A6J5RBJ8_9CAUD|nr:hypothetical protein UFOVP1264_28 [uncultured Caudovirales phage]